MARSFLTVAEIESAKSILQPSHFRATKVRVHKRPPEQNSFSLWLGDQLLHKLTKLPHWQEALPIILGSWARYEICPRSDIDLLFCGPEDQVKLLVNDLNLLGLKIRYRTPENYEDWTQGVDNYDIMALLQARSFSPSGQDLLHHQQQVIQADIKKWRKEWFQVMTHEKKMRADRYDSISNYLEPNIKYGQGGLRDLQQSLFLMDIFPEKFADREDVKFNLLHHKEFLLNIRQHMHLYGLDEVLVATEQKALSEWMGFAKTKDFMREVQWSLSEVSFYSDWIFERAKTSEKKLNQYRLQNLKKLPEAFNYLQQDTSLQAQEVVRNHLNLLTNDHQQVLLGSLLKKIFKSWPQEKYVRALFSSGLLELCLPELHRLRGLVQHDQYHRFTVRAHLLQCMREVLRLRSRPKNLGRLSQWVKVLTEDDWQILLWTALFHDMAKGKKGDHSTQGAELVKKEFVKMKISLRQTVEVAWMVQNHLLLSTAAFRRDPQDPKTWEKLHELGVKGSRLVRLAVFTALDIRATNMEAWNDWKEKLLNQLVLSVQSPKATQFMQLLSAAQAKKIKISSQFLSALDPSLVESIPTKILIKDYQLVKKSKKDLEPLVWKDQRGFLWVRFHRREDKSGLFVLFTQSLFSAGCNVQECFIQTFAKYGVYDWFYIKSNKTPTQLKKILNLLDFHSEIKVPKVQFDKITVMNEDPEQAVISFRGKNKSGALLTAAQALYDQGFDIIWARAHTWGRQIDDVFCIKKTQSDLGEKVSNLKKQLLMN
ncbi:MAG: HD domain-containing protein [Bdellovibrionales bacterium]|nr:HD domain-containing protein [Bdellovibrionales bacterium]